MRPCRSTRMEANVQHQGRHEGEAGDHDRQALGVERTGRGGAAGRVLAAVVVAVYAWWAVALESFSSHATFAVVLAGSAAMVIGARQRPPTHRQRAGGRAGTARWAVLGAVAGAWQLAAYVQHPRADHPTVSSLTNAVLDSRAARTAAFILWIAAARALARR
jgi:hypothetical protein